MLTVALAGCFHQYRSPGSFSVDCRYSHSRPDDPIVHPGHPGGSHLHDFYGNTSTSARSTYTSMRSSPTTCRLESDGAGYWTPSAFLDGVQVTPTRIAVYYFGGQSDVESLPRDLRMISGRSGHANGGGRHLPKVSVRVHYPIVDPCLGAEPCGPEDASDGNIRLTFSSGDHTTFHGDFWNTWDQKPLNRLVERCLNAGLECGKQA